MKHNAFYLHMAKDIYRLFYKWF